MILRIEDLTFSYNSHPVLEDISFSMSPGELVAVLGPNGAGKTTLLKCINAIHRPKNGTVYIDGRDVSGLSLPTIAWKMVYVAQRIEPSRVTAFDAVLMGRRPHVRWGVSRHDLEKVDAALRQLAIKDLSMRYIDQMSGGELQKVAIARALVQEPKLMLLDEPTASIDTKGQVDFYALLKELNREIPILVVSHDLLVVSRYIKSVACVNRRLHYHDQAEITGEMLETMYPCTAEEVCPVELVAHGLPHRVLIDHEKQPR